MDAKQPAPGGPGILPRWTSSAKTGVGTAIGPTSRVWFTFSHGILNEIYYPRVDLACTRDMGLIVTAGQGFLSEEKRHTHSEIAYLADGVPAYRLTNTCEQGRYQIEKEVIIDPQRSVALQRIRFKPLQGKLSDYRWAGFGMLGEILPWDDNRVELADERDHYGLPVAKVTFSLKDNDKKLIAFGKNKVIEVIQAAGAEEVVQEALYAHLIGGARMGADPRSSVVDIFGRTHDIANLFLCDGSTFPTQGSANPGLTIQALAARIADHLISEAQHGDLRRHPPTLEEPQIRYDLSPPTTWGKGVPRYTQRER